MRRSPLQTHKMQGAWESRTPFMFLVTWVVQRMNTNVLRIRAFPDSILLYRLEMTENRFVSVFNPVGMEPLVSITKMTFRSVNVYDWCMNNDQQNIELWWGDRAAWRKVGSPGSDVNFLHFRNYLRNVTCFFTKPKFHHLVQTCTFAFTFAGLKRAFWGVAEDECDLHKLELLCTEIG